MIARIKKSFGCFGRVLKNIATNIDLRTDTTYNKQNNFARMRKIHKWIERQFSGYSWINGCLIGRLEGIGDWAVKTLEGVVVEAIGEVAWGQRGCRPVQRQLWNFQWRLQEREIHHLNNLKVRNSEKCKLKADFEGKLMRWCFRPGCYCWSLGWMVVGRMRCRMKVVSWIGPRCGSLAVSTESSGALPCYSSSGKKGKL